MKLHLLLLALLFAQTPAHCQEFASAELEHRWLDRLMSSLASADGPTKITATSMAVAILAQSDHIEDAMALVKKQEDPSRRSPLLAMIAVEQARLGKTADALATCSELPAEERERPLKGIAMVRAEQGDTATASSIITDLTRDFDRGQALHSLCIAYARAGKLDEARDRLALIKDKYWQRKASDDLQKAAIGKTNPISEVQGSIRDRIDLLTAFSAEGVHDRAILAIVAAQRGDADAVHAFVHESMREIQTPELASRKTITAILATVAVMELGQADGAGKLILDVKKLADRDWTAIAGSFGTPIIATLLVKLKLEAELNDLIEGIRAENADHYEVIFEAVGCALVETGQLEKSETYYKALSNPREKAYFEMGALAGSNYLRQAQVKEPKDPPAIESRRKGCCLASPEPHWKPSRLSRKSDRVLQRDP